MIFTYTQLKLRYIKELSIVNIFLIYNNSI